MNGSALTASASNPSTHQPINNDLRLTTIEDVIALALMLTLPVLIAACQQGRPKNLPFVRWISRVDPIVLAYICGITIGSVVRVERSLATPIGGLGVGLCLPLMLINLDLRQSARQFPSAIKTMLVFSCLVMITASTAAHLIFWIIPDPLIPKIASMLTGTFVGSAPNLAAVGVSLEVPQSEFLYAQSSDLLLSGGFFIFLMAVGIPWIKPRIPLKPWQIPANISTPTKAPASFRGYVISFTISLVIVLLAFFGARILTDNKSIADLLTLTLISLLSILAGMSSLNRKLPDTMKLGEHVFLYFCIATGSQLSFNLLPNLPPSYIVLGAMILVGSVLLHFIYCYLKGIDQDLFITTLASGIFSPAMVGPIAFRLANRHMLAVGVTTGLIGLALGTLCGMGVFHMFTLMGFGQP